MPGNLQPNAKTRDLRTNDCACIRSITIIGERCSGTNWLTKLCAANFEIDVHNEGGGGTFGWKHNPAGLENQELLAKHRDSTLFIFITRNVCDWIEHFYKNPWHVPRRFLETRETFVMHEPWLCNRETNGTGDELDDVDRQTGERFRNLLDLRARKHAHWRTLCETKGNSDEKPIDALLYNEWVRYEDLLQNPAAFLDRLRQKYTLTPVGIKWNTLEHNYKGLNRQMFSARKTKINSFHFNFARNARKWSAAMLQHVKENVDWEVERDLGYSDFAQKFISN